MFDSMLKENGQTMQVHLSSQSKKKYKFEHQRVQMVYMNLLKNAITFSPIGASIMLSVDVVDKPHAVGEPSTIIVELKDNGIGMSQE